MPGVTITRQLPEVPLSPNVLLSPESAEVFREAVSVMQDEYGKPAGRMAAANIQQVIYTINLLL